MNRSEKEELVAQVRETLMQAKCIVITQQSGLTVSEVTDLRRQMRAAGAEFKVLKNTLAKIAIAGTPMEGLSELLEGPTALAFSTKDAVAPAKVASEFSNKNRKLKLVGGYLEGKVLDSGAIDVVAKLPSIDELRSRIISVILAPATKLAILAKEPGTRVARVLSVRGSGV
jgi:large subunit ribosomal protein L10